MNDQEMIIRAVREAQLNLAQHIEPGDCDADRTIHDLLTILDRSELVEATDRLEGALGLLLPY